MGKSALSPSRRKLAKLAKVAKKDKKKSKEAKTTTKEEKNVTKEPKKVTKEAKDVTNKPQNLNKETKNAAKESKNTTKEAKNVTKENTTKVAKNTTKEAKNTTKEAKNTTKEAKNTTNEDDNNAPGKRGTPPPQVQQGKEKKRKEASPAKESVQVTAVPVEKKEKKQKKSHKEKKDKKTKGDDVLDGDTKAPSEAAAPSEAGCSTTASSRASRRASGQETDLEVRRRIPTKTATAGVAQQAEDEATEKAKKVQQLVDEGNRMLKNNPDLLRQLEGDSNSEAEGDGDLDAELAKTLEEMHVPEGENNDPDLDGEELSSEEEQQPTAPDDEKANDDEDEEEDAVSSVSDLASSLSSSETEDDDDSDQDSSEEDDDEKNTDQKNADQKDTDQENTDQKNADQKNADQKNSDQKNTDQKYQKNADQNNADQKNADQSNPHALVAVANTADQLVTTQKAKRNSVTHHTEWVAFCRQAGNKKVFPASLSGNFLSNKVDLFNQWLDQGKDWTKLELAVSRSAEQSSSSKRQLRAVQGHELVKSKGEDKAKKLMAKRKAAGLYYLDEDFPEDDLETWYYMWDGHKLACEAKTNEKMELQAKQKLDGAMLKALTSEGPLQAGALPDGFAATEAGQKKLHEVLHSEAVMKRKPAPKPKPDESEPVAPKSLRENVDEKLPLMLSEATTARKLSIAVQSAPFSGELSKQLMLHGNQTEKLYKLLDKMSKDPKTPERKLAGALTMYENKKMIFESAQAAAESILSGLKKAKKPKKKGKKNDDDDANDAKPDIDAGNKS